MKMKTRTTFVITLMAALALSGAAVANGNHGHNGAPGTDEPGAGNPDRMQMMMARHGQMMGGCMGMMERRGQMMNGDMGMMDGKMNNHGQMMGGGTRPRDAPSQDDMDEN